MPSTLTSEFARGSEYRHGLEKAVQDKLNRSKYRGLRRISCRFNGEVLQLCGTVSSYYEKQIAQTLVLPLLNPDVHFENRVEVCAVARK